MEHMSYTAVFLTNFLNSAIYKILRTLFWRNFLEDLFSRIDHIKTFYKGKTEKRFLTNILSPWGMLIFTRENFFRPPEVFLNQTLYLFLLILEQ